MLIIEYLESGDCQYLLACIWAVFIVLCVHDIHPIHVNSVNPPFKNNWLLINFHMYTLLLLDPYRMNESVNFCLNPMSLTFIETEVKRSQIKVTILTYNLIGYLELSAFKKNQSSNYLIPALFKGYMKLHWSWEHCARHKKYPYIFFFFLKFICCISGIYRNPLWSSG